MGRAENFDAETAIVQNQNRLASASIAGQSFAPMKITEDVRKCAGEQGTAGEEALKKRMEEKSREFTEKGSELYAKA